MSKYEIDIWEYSDTFKNLDTNETFGGYGACELLEQKDAKISDLEAKLAEYEQSNKVLNDQLNKATEHISELNEQLAEKGQEVETLKAKLETAEYWNKKYDDCQQQHAEKDLRIEELESQYAYECECNKQFVECQNENEELKQQLAVTEKALKLAREYMFNVMCADDVPFESWFIVCAKNDWKPS